MSNILEDLKNAINNLINNKQAVNTQLPTQPYANIGIKANMEKYNNKSVGSSASGGGGNSLGNTTPAKMPYFKNPYISNVTYPTNTQKVITPTLSQEQVVNPITPYNPTSSGVPKPEEQSPIKEEAKVSSSDKAVDVPVKKEYKLLKTDTEKSNLYRWANSIGIKDPMALDSGYDIEKAYVDFLAGKDVKDLSSYKEVISTNKQATQGNVNPLQVAANNYKLPNISDINHSILNKLNLTTIRGLTPEKIIETENNLKNTWGSIPGLVQHIQKEYIDKGKKPPSALFTEIYNNYNDKVKNDSYFTAYDKVTKMLNLTPTIPKPATTNITNITIEDPLLKRVKAGEGKITTTSIPLIDYKNIESLKNLPQTDISALENIIKTQYGSLKAYADELKKSTDKLTDYQIWIRDNLGSKPEETKTEEETKEEEEVVKEEEVIKKLENLNQLDDPALKAYSISKLRDLSAKYLSQYGSFEAMAKKLIGQELSDPVRRAVYNYYYPVKLKK